MTCAVSRNKNCERIPPYTACDPCGSNKVHTEGTTVAICQEINGVLTEIIYTALEDTTDHPISGSTKVPPTWKSLTWPVLISQHIKSQTSTHCEALFAEAVDKGNIL